MLPTYNKVVVSGTSIRLSRLHFRCNSSSTQNPKPSPDKKDLISKSFEILEQNKFLKDKKSLEDVFPDLNVAYENRPKVHLPRTQKRLHEKRQRAAKDPNPVIVKPVTRVIKAQKGSLPESSKKTYEKRKFPSIEYTTGFEIPEDYVKVIDSSGITPVLSQSFDAESNYQPLNIKQETQVPTLKHKLSRVLFSPGVHYLQDPRSKVFNFDPYLQNILPVNEFNFDHITQYVTSHKDKAMMEISEKLGTKYYSSTSSMTGILSHLHFFLSNFKPVYCGDLSTNMEKRIARFSRGAQLPGIVIVRKMPGGKFAIDSDKSSDREIVLSLLGHSLERLLVSDPEFFEKYKKSNTNEEALKEIKEIEENGNAYHYAKMGDFIMRSQLDCKDSRLPGTGTFDLKTRAVCAVRHDMIKNEQEVTGYEIVKTNGQFESFERELFELAKSTLLKYGLQARIGNMDGIFILFHNIAKTFGFQYLPLNEIDKIIHSVGIKPKIIRENKSKADLESINNEEIFNKLATKVANEEFTISMKIWNKILDMITTDYLPNTSFRLIFKSVLATPYESVLHIVAHPVADHDIETIQSFGFKSSQAVMSDDNNLISEHVNKLRILNKELGKGLIGFRVAVRHKFNGVETRLKFPKHSSLDDKWDVDIKIFQNSLSTVTNHYEKYMDEKIKMLESTGGAQDDEVSNYVKLLREFGKKWKQRAATEDNKRVVWNKD